ncbi:MAG: ankyrin repeat domain-containing protein [Kofleriaceae bacterium]
MSESLPVRPDLGWLRKRAKAERGTGTLAAAQLAIARRYSFTSWRALVVHVEQIRTVSGEVPEARVAAFLQHVGRGELAAVATMLRETPTIVNAIGPHPFWGGRPQPLHVAIEGSRPEMVTLILQAGADVDGSNAEYSHWSPLLIAVGNPDQSRKRGRSRRALLKRGATIGLVEALAMADDEIVLRKLKRGRAALPANTPGDGSLLMWARTPAAIDRLLALGVSADAAERSSTGIARWPRGYSIAAPIPMRDPIASRTTRCCTPPHGTATSRWWSSCSRVVPIPRCSTPSITTHPPVGPTPRSPSRTTRPAPRLRPGYGRTVIVAVEPLGGCVIAS